MDSIYEFNFSKDVTSTDGMNSFLPSGKVEAVFGQDTRIEMLDPQFPYSSILLLQVLFGNKLYRVTGFLVKQDRIVTAAHCIYDPRTNRFADSVTVRWHPNNQTSYRSIACTGGCCASEYLNNVKTSNDWAILKLSTPIRLNAIPCVDIATIPQIDLCEAAVAGYPMEVKGNVNANATLWGATGVVHRIPSKNVLTYTISTSSGQSGAPVIVQYQQNYCAVGIHAASDSDGNKARAIDAQLYQIIMSY